MVDTVELLKKLKEHDDFKAITEIREDGSYEVDLDFYKHSYEGSLSFYWETGFEGSMASIVEDDRGLHEDGFHRSLSWAVFIQGGEYLEVYNDEKIVWEGILIRDFERIFNKDRKPYFMGYGIEDKQWEDWFGSNEPLYRGKIYTNKPVLAEDPEWKDKYE